MSPERIHQITAAFPWLPADYLRILPRVSAGNAVPLYGLEWFDGPLLPGDAFGAVVGAQFPSVVWIGRRAGNPVGYADWQSERPRLREWAGSEKRVVQEYNGIAGLALSTVLYPGYDRRPAIPNTLQLHGLAMGPWHRSGDETVARAILLPEEEAGVIDALVAGLRHDWSLCLVREDNDSWVTIRPRANGFEVCLDHHGSGGTPRAVGIGEAVTELVALAHCNDGSHPAYHAHLTVSAHRIATPVGPA